MVIDLIPEGWGRPIEPEVMGKSMALSVCSRCPLFESNRKSEISIWSKRMILKSTDDGSESTWYCRVTFVDFSGVSSILVEMDRDVGEGCVGEE